MSEIKLLPCPFCGGEAKLEEYYETCDGRGDKHAKIMCGKCRTLMVLTFDEFVKAEKDFEYRGGYYSRNKKFWNGMHQRLIDKWNTRKPMQEIIERLEEYPHGKYTDDYGKGFSVAMNTAIEIVKEVGGIDGVC